MVKTFRSVSRRLTENTVRRWIQQQNIFDALYNPTGISFSNHFELIENGLVVFDHASGLMWQRAGSEQVAYRGIKNWLYQLNSQSFANYKDWRLPTLEEALTLLEPQKQEQGLFLAPLFSNIQKKIWTADVKSKASAWAVFFNEGHCYYSDTYQVFPSSYYYLRAIR